MSSLIIDKLVNILPLIDIEHYHFGTVIINKQSNCRKRYLNAVYLGMRYNILKSCNLISCTPCYNYKLFKLQKEIISALKKIIKEPQIVLLLRRFTHSKEDSLINWIERNKSELKIILTDFKAIFSTLSPKNTETENTLDEINKLKKYTKLLYKNINRHLGEFTLFDFKPDDSEKINVHSHSIILLDKNSIYTSEGRELRYNVENKIGAILASIKYHEERSSKWINTYYDLFKIIAYITKPRPKDFDDKINALSWLKAAISIYNNRENFRYFRNYTMSGILSKTRTQNNKECKKSKLLKAVQTPMSIKKDDYILLDEFRKKLFAAQVKKETDYSIKNTGFIIFPESDHSIYQYVELYKKRPDVFVKIRKNVDTKRVKAISMKTKLSVSKIENLSITVRDDIEYINGTFRQVKLIKRKNGKSQKVYSAL